ncbi:AB hydrolase-1 domain-containing protein [Mycena venus]|uniref:AB hydrolase-1 domain-containing protein n=1 Tax=Mycena venus TaxID=2733690 RepID=A0A8H6WYP8_9AGAR|nr:AB hydrolase-1 domain-containing protein [Mycena venus]
MPTVIVPGKGIRFFFTDTGPPLNVPNYTTFILVHGHTYHAGVFQRLLPLTEGRSVRIICINRREYPGSTPHTAEELKVYTSGSQGKRATLLNEAGVNLALCVNEIIQQCALSSAGGVALVGWSLGNTFTMAAMASILGLPAPVKERLQNFVKTIIVWDAPSHALGIKSPPNAYVPLFDQDLAPKARGPAFGKWLESYFIHGNLSSRDPDQLNYRTHDPSRKRSFEDLPFGELLKISHFTVGDNCDTVLMQPPFASAISAIVNRALFSGEIRAAWPHTQVSYIYGEANTWDIPFAAWNIEERVREARGKAPINFRPIDGANHFVRLFPPSSSMPILIVIFQLFWDDPKKALDELIGCIKV